MERKWIYNKHWNPSDTTLINLRKITPNAKYYKCWLKKFPETKIPLYYTNKNNQTLLMIACEYNDIKLLNFLFKDKFMPQYFFDLCDNFGNSSIFYLINRYKYFIKSIHYLTSENVSKRNIEGENCLFYAAKHNLNIFDCLLNYTTFKTRIILNHQKMSCFDNIKSKKYQDYLKKDYFNELIITHPYWMHNINKCNICYEFKDGYSSIIGCGHIFCSECMSKLVHCPYCDKKIEKKIKVFF